MKILWVTTPIIGPAAAIFDKTYGGTSGGWINAAYEKLSIECKNEISFLCGTNNVKYGDYVKKTTGSISAYAIGNPSINYGVQPSKKYISVLKKIIAEVSPDIIHIWGTESTLVTAVANIKTKIPKIIFIQGLLGMHKKYESGYLEQNRNIHLVKYHMNVLYLIKEKLKKRFFVRQSIFEEQALRNVDYIFTDNEFTIAYCESINTKAVILPVTLSINKVFLEKKWNINMVNRKTIMTVFSPVPNKGLHQLLFSLAIVKQKHPNILLLIPGDFTYLKKKRNPYNRYINQIIKKYSLFNNCKFIGKQNQSDLSALLEKTEIFVNPSCMEVHGGSLREAMFVGVPIISAISGSILEFVENNQSGLLYRYEEYEVLAHLINKLICDDDLKNKLSIGSKTNINYFYNNNKKNLDEIYSDILNNHSLSFVKSS